MPIAQQRRPTALVHVDVDSLWAIRRGYGLDGGRPLDLACATERDDPVWEEAVPRMLELFASMNVSATFFVIGSDALVPARRARLAAIAAAGHELANHSYSHRLDLAALSADEIHAEIQRAQDAIGVAADCAPAGFRCPGYGVDNRLMGIIRDHGFRYDSSVLPGPWGGAMRAIARRLARGGSVGPLQYGSWRCARAPRQPYHPSPADFCAPSLARVNGHQQMVEIPVSVAPLLRQPFHASVSLSLGMGYFGACLWAHRRLTPHLTFVFHAVDLLDASRLELAGGAWGRRFFGAPLERKARQTRAMLAAIAATHDIARSDRWTADFQNPIDQEPAPK